MKHIEKLAKIINDFFVTEGVELDVSPLELAYHLAANGVIVIPKREDIVKEMQNVDDIIGDIMRQMMLQSLSNNNI